MTLFATASTTTLLTAILTTASSPRLALLECSLKFVLKVKNRLLFFGWRKFDILFDLKRQINSHSKTNWNIHCNWKGTATRNTLQHEIRPIAQSLFKTILVISCMRQNLTIFSKGLIISEEWDRLIVLLLA